MIAHFVINHKMSSISLPFHVSHTEGEEAMAAAMAMLPGAAARNVTSQAQSMDDSDDSDDLEKAIQESGTYENRTGVPSVVSLLHIFDYRNGKLRCQCSAV
jgi:hypothetical protein